MKLSISNLAWNEDNDTVVYDWMQKLEYQGLEIAPTRLFKANPYDCLDEAKKFMEFLKTTYNLDIVSMQSIWYGKKQSIFGTCEERNYLLEYTKKAIIFAENIKCPNIVFGCPKNRIIKEPEQIEVAIGFFDELGKYALEHNTVIALEPNPRIYNTNFINTTREAIEFCKLVCNKGIKVNFDFGSVLENNENFCFGKSEMQLINHIHISEPYLKVIKKRELHKELKKILLKNDYNGFISIEMNSDLDLRKLKETMKYVKEVFI